MSEEKGKGKRKKKKKKKILCSANDQRVLLRQDKEIRGGVVVAWSSR